MEKSWTSKPDGIIVEAAIEQANKSPCEKSKRGSVVHDFDGQIWGQGFNSPPMFSFPEVKCTRDEACKSRCNKWCVHAESRAVRDALYNGAAGRFEYPDLRGGLYLLHIKTIDGEPVPSGPPSCWQCSREILDCGIDGVWLLHESGWQFYGARLFHHKTLKHCGIIE